MNDPSRHRISRLPISRPATRSLFGVWPLFSRFVLRSDRAVPYRKETIFAALDAGLIFAQDARSLFQQNDAAVVRINVAGNDAADISGLTGIHRRLQHARNERPCEDQHIAVANVAA